MISYRIIDEEDASYSTVKRFTQRVALKAVPTEEELRELCASLVWMQLAEHGTDTSALAFFFWVEGTDFEGMYTAGVADWAPYGEWGKAGNVKPGDLQHHRLNVVVRGRSLQ